MARLNNDHAAARSWTKTAESIKEEINARLWDDDKSLFWDNDRNQQPNSLHPQDGNA